MGTYKELSEKEGGAFMKLMEWQINGGEEGQPPAGAVASQAERGPPSEQEEIDELLRDEEVYDEEFDDETDEGAKARGEKQSVAEKVVEKAGEKP